MLYNMCIKGRKNHYLQGENDRNAKSMKESKTKTDQQYTCNRAHVFPRSARNAPISLPLLLIPPIAGLGNPNESLVSTGNPSNSSRGDKGLCGRTTPGARGKELPTGDGNEGDCEVESDLFDD